MSVLDVDQLVAPLDGDEPSGENLEYDPEFGELERTAQGSDEHVMGDEVVEAEPPDWSAVLKLGEALCGRTKDFRVGVFLTRAAANIHGPAGIADGTAILRGFAENLWDTVHPQLDAEDDNDPTFRVNSIMPLGDRDGIVRDILNMKLVSSKVVGQFSLRDIRVAKGELQPAADQENVPDTALIAAAFMDCDVEQLQEDARCIDEAVENLGKFEAIFAEQIGAANSPNVTPLVDELKVIQGVYNENLAARGIGVEVVETPAEGGAAGGGAGGGAPISGEVNSREDVIRMIDKICLYYDRNEPSSPVPLLMQRAKRLVNKGFLDIMRDLAPGGVGQAESIGGVGYEAGSSSSSSSSSSSGSSESKDDSW